MKLLLKTTLLTLLCSTSLSAATLVGVDWGGTDLTISGEPLTLTNITSSGAAYTSHSTSTALTSGLAVYTAQPIYGILQNETSTGAAAFGRVSLYGGTADYITITGTPYNAEAPASRSISGLVYIKKADFLNGLSGSAPLRFSEESTLTANLQQLIAGGTRLARMAIMNDGTWYLSQPIRGAVGAFTVSDPVNTNWAAWDPSGTPLSPDPTSFTVAGSTFEDIQAFGLYFYNSIPDTGAFAIRQPSFGLDSLTGSFEAIPEPSSLELLGLAGGALTLLIRRSHLLS